MPMEWIKDYVNHRRKRRFSEVGFWGAIIVEHCWRLAGEFHWHDGNITEFWYPAKFATELDWPPELRHEIEPAMQRAVEVGLIEERPEGFFVHNWRVRQSPPKNSTPRVQKHRAKKKSESETPPHTPPDENRGEERRGEGNVSCNDETVSCNGETVTSDEIGSPPPSPAPFSVFNSFLAGLVAKEHGNGAGTTGGGESKGRFRDLGISECHGEDCASCSQQCEPAMLAEWAILHSEDWANGTHWRHIIHSPMAYWRNYDELRRQYRAKGKKQRTKRVSGRKVKLKAITLEELQERMKAKKGGSGG